MTPKSSPIPSPGPANLPAVVPPLRAEIPWAQSPSARTDPIALLRALRRRWPLALVSGLLGAAVAALAAYLLVPPAKYTARAMLHVNSVRPRILLQVGETNSEYGAYQRTQLALLKSRLVLNAALKQPDVVKLKALADKVDPIEWLEKELQVDFANGSEILRISMSGSVAAEPMVLVNATMQAYMDEVVDVEAKQRRERYDLLKETWNRYQENLREKRKELKRLTELAGSDDKRTIASIHQHELDRLGRAEDEMAQIQSELRSLRVECEVLQEKGDRNATMTSPAMIEDAISKDRSIELLQERMALAQKALDQASRLVRIGSDPSVKRHRDELESARTALAAQRRKLYPIVARQLQEVARDDDGSKGDLLQDRIKILTKLEAALAGDVKRLSERSRSITRNSVDLFSIQEEIANADEVAKAIGKEVEALTVELLAPPRIRLLEKAELPRTKDELQPIKVAGMAGCGACALALAGVSLWEFRARRVDSADEVVMGLGINMVGTLPLLPSRGRALESRGKRGERWRHLLIESVDSVRTSLLHVSRTESARVVMVAGALGGEGKTSLASHLALSLARAGRRTLLIDGDLRRPSAHQLFDVAPGPGFSEVLLGVAKVTDVIQPTAASGVWMIPAGQCDGRAIQALASKDLRPVIDRLKEDFDFIVIDSSPVLLVTDALLIAQHADAVLFSVMRHVSRLPKVHAAFERMASLGIRILGAVVTGARSDLYGGDYQYVHYATRSQDQA